MCYQVFMSPSERPCGTWEWRTRAQQKGAVCFNRCVPGEADELRVSGLPACRAEEGSGSINKPEPPLLYSHQTTETLTALRVELENTFSVSTVKPILQPEVISAVDSSLVCNNNTTKVISACQHKLRLGWRLGISWRGALLRRL